MTIADLRAIIADSTLDPNTEAIAISETFGDFSILGAQRLVTGRLDDDRVPAAPVLAIRIGELP